MNPHCKYIKHILLTAFCKVDLTCNARRSHFNCYFSNLYLVETQQYIYYLDLAYVLVVRLLVLCATSKVQIEVVSTVENDNNLRPLVSSKHSTPSLLFIDRAYNPSGQRSSTTSTTFRIE